MDIKECLDKNLLKKEMPDLSLSKKSLDMAKAKLEKAKELLKLNILDMAEINAYSAMFHSSRALLFRDGYREKSHYAIYIYLKEKYSGVIEQKFLNELNVLRLDRHEIFYGFEEPELDEKAVSNMIVIAEEFIKAMHHIIFKKNGSKNQPQVLQQSRLF